MLQDVGLSWQGWKSRQMAWKDGRDQSVNGIYKSVSQLPQFEQCLSLYIKVLSCCIVSWEC